MAASAASRRISGQRRFVNDLDRFARLLEQSRDALSGLEGASLGIAPHSLRAVTAQELTDIVPLAEDGPIHIHVAEQMKEVEDCLSWSGARPVEWLLAHAPVDKRWCLIHATHMTRDETRAVASAGAVAGLCPITEANLGDGTFNAPEFIGFGGEFGIGSDSHVLIGVADELRQLEYSQRLRHRARNVMAGEEGRSTGRALYEAALARRNARGRRGKGWARRRRARGYASRSMPPTPPWSGAPATLFSTRFVFSARGSIDRLRLASRQEARGRRAASASARPCSRVSAP